MESKKPVVVVMPYNLDLIILYYQLVRSQNNSKKLLNGQKIICTTSWFVLNQNVQEVIFMNVVMSPNGTSKNKYYLTKCSVCNKGPSLERAILKWTEKGELENQGMIEKVVILFRKIF